MSFTPPRDKLYIYGTHTPYDIDLHWFRLIEVHVDRYEALTYQRFEVYDLQHNLCGHVEFTKENLPTGEFKHRFEGRIFIEHAESYG